MTVEDLIARLEKFPKQSKVLIQASEGGLLDVTQTDLHTIALNVHPVWWKGPHQPIRTFDEDELYAEYDQALGVIIS